MSDTDSRNAPSSPPQQRLLDEFEPPSLEAWHQEVVRLLKGAPFEKRMHFETYEGISVRALYTRGDTEDLEHLASLPGDAPFPRATSVLGYRREPWWVAQELPYPDYQEFHAALKEALERGQTAVNLLLDLASQAGRDPDQSPVGAVGFGGTSISSILGLSQALAGVDLEHTPILVQPGSAALPFAAMLVAHLRRERRQVSRLRGSLGLDPLAGLVTHGALPLTLDRAYDELAALTRWAAAQAPHLRTVSAYGFPYHEAGGNAVQELAFTLAAAVHALRELEGRGVDTAVVIPRLQFGFSVGAHFFMEIAKLRAARMLWARIAETSGGGDSGRMAIHARTAAWGTTAVDPYVNILRGTTAAFAAVMGGCDSLHVEPFDGPLGLPTELARRLARNTQLILRDECHLDAVIDPAGGSWLVESLTAELARKAWELFQRVEAGGGLLAALREGWPQGEVAAVAEQRRRNVAVRKDVLVGTTMYPNASEELPSPRQADPAAFHAVRSRALEALRTSPEHAAAPEALTRLQEILGSAPEELFESLVAAAAVGATIGEMTKALGHGDSAGIRVTPLQVHRGAEAFETLRRRVESWRRKHPGVQVFMANVGPVAGYMPRLDFTKAFFQVGGFSVDGDRSFSGAQEAVAAAVASIAPVVVIVSTDDRYPEVVPAIVTGVKAARPEALVVLAGLPKDHVESFRQAGIDEFIHVRADVPALLGGLADRMGVAS